MSKAFVDDDRAATDALRPLPVGRRPVTAAGHGAMKRELHHLIKDQLMPLRARVADEPAAASALRVVEHRVRMLQRQIELSDVAAPAPAKPTQVTLGTRVVVRDEDTDARLTYVLVGPDEVDLGQRKVSCHSPVGQALIGKKVAERAFIKRPAGTAEVWIEGIFGAEFPSI